LARKISLLPKNNVKVKSLASPPKRFATRVVGAGNFVHESTKKGPKPNEIPLEYEGHNTAPRKIRGDAEMSKIQELFKEASWRTKIEHKIKGEDKKIKRGKVHNPTTCPTKTDTFSE